MACALRYATNKCLLEHLSYYLLGFLLLHFKGKAHVNAKRATLVILSGASVSSRKQNG